LYDRPEYYREIVTGNRRHKYGFTVTSAAMNWSHRIRCLRKTGLTLAAIGDRIGLSPGAVCDLEKGRTGAPRGDAALALDALYRERIDGVKPRGRARPAEVAR